jgi:hypothetical protein
VQENDKLVEEVHVPHQPDRMVQDASLGKGLQSPGTSNHSLRGSDEPLLYLKEALSILILNRERAKKYLKPGGDDAVSPLQTKRVRRLLDEKNRESAESSCNNRAIAAS